jgi:plasmid stability protein
MKRTQIQLDDAVYEALRRRAFERQTSMAAVVREVLAEALGLGKGPRRASLADFSFVGCGRSAERPERPVSEHHDEALVEALSEKLHRR